MNPSLQPSSSGDAASTLRSALLMLVLAVVLPWLVPYTPLPLRAFYREWVYVAMLGLCALLLATAKPAAALSLRSPLLAMAGVLSLWAVVQSVVLDDVLGPALMFMGYMMVFVCSMAVGAAFASIDRRRFESRLCWSIIIAGGASCVLAACQLAGLDHQIPLIAPRAFKNVYGNISQANHFADVLWLTSVALAVVYSRGEVRTPFVVAGAIMLTTMSVFSAARSVWLYAGFLFVLGLGVVLVSRKASGFANSLEARRFGVVLACTGALFPVVATMMHASGILDFFDVHSGISRFTDDVTGTNLRFWLWSAGIEAARQHPWTGVGLGHFVGFSSALTAVTPTAPANGGDMNAHNLFFHLAAELGLPGVLIIFAAIMAWLWQLRGGLRRLEVSSLALCAFFGVLFLHSQIEFPFWYTYFLGLFGLMAGGLVSSAPGANSDVRGGGGLFVCGLTLVAVSLVAYLHFRPLEKAMQELTMQVGLGAAPQTDERLVAQLARVPTWSPYWGYADAIDLLSAIPGRENAANLVKRCERRLATAPSPYLLSRCAAAGLVARDIEAAQRYSEWMCKVFPRNIDTLAGSLLLVSDAIPAGFQPSCMKLSRNAGPAGPD